MDINFGSFPVIENDKLVSNPSSDVINEKFDIMLPDLDDNSYYTVVMYDSDSDQPDSGVFIHYLLFNVVNDGEGEELYSYVSPDPQNGETHQYNIDIYKQPYEMDISITDNMRNDFDLEGLVTDNEFKIRHRASFLYPYNNKINNNKINKNKKHKNIFVSGSTLSENEKKYCSCVLSVASKQPSSDIRDRTYLSKFGNYTKGKYNPYAVCSASTKSTSQKCGTNYDFEAMPDELLRAYVNLMSKSIKENGITVPPDEKYNRKRWLKIVYQYKSLEE
uniref:HeH/LEM domain protein n=1 Tax=Pithovirus LCPAC101 TaxID=2506586 RepID=A0A481Z2P9_9VIRU|nr:MAG: HeH/LEM domain protein [Pithovirus LCPAC101]